MPSAAGEAYVTADGGEAEIDVGIIDRLVKGKLTAKSSLTLGGAIEDLHKRQRSEKDTGYDVLHIEKNLVPYLCDYVIENPELMNTGNPAAKSIRIVQLGGNVFDMGNAIFSRVIHAVEAKAGEVCFVLTTSRPPEEHEALCARLAELGPVRPTHLIQVGIRQHASNKFHVHKINYEALARAVNHGGLCQVDGTAHPECSAAAASSVPLPPAAEENPGTLPPRHIKRERSHSTSSCSHGVHALLEAIFPDSHARFPTPMSVVTSGRLSLSQDVPSNSSDVIGTALGSNLADINGDVSDPVPKVCGISESKDVVFACDSPALDDWPATLPIDSSDGGRSQDESSQQSQTSLPSQTSRASRAVRISFVTRFAESDENYFSIVESLRIAARHLRIHLTLHPIDARTLSVDNLAEKIGTPDTCSGILIPGGFGDTAHDKLMLTIKYAREKDIPFLGICLGMQMLCCEYAKDACGIERADSIEMNKETPNPVINWLKSFLPRQGQAPTGESAGAEASYKSMRLGDQPVYIQADSKVAECYRGSNLRTAEFWECLRGGQLLVAMERHWHSLGLYPKYRSELERKGLRVSATDETGLIALAVEVANQRFCVGTQYHPEFSTKVNEPHPLFLAYLSACAGGFPSQE